MNGSRGEMRDTRTPIMRDTRTPIMRDTRTRATALDLLALKLASGERVSLEVLGHSMAPEVLPADTVVLARGENALRHGDVAALRAPGGRVLVHRVLGKRCRGSRTWLLTKGDAERLADPWSPLEAILGRVIEVRRAGVPVRAALTGPSARRRAAVSGLEAWLAGLRLGRFLPKPARQAGWSLIERSLSHAGRVSPGQVAPGHPAPGSLRRGGCPCPSN